MSQKGGVILIIIILVLIVGLLVGGYFISQNTNFFSKAGSAQITIPLPSPSVAPKPIPLQSATSSAVYENPFEGQVAIENPFSESYQNPFNNL
jgi:hypothetical protein